MGSASWSDAIAAWIRYGAAAVHDPVDDLARFRDLPPVPQRAVLVGEQDKVLPVRTGKPGPAARVVQQHQREQPPRLRLAGQQRGEHPAEPDRLRGQVPGLTGALYPWLKIR